MIAVLINPNVSSSPKRKQTVRVLSDGLIKVLVLGMLGPLCEREYKRIDVASVDFGCTIVIGPGDGRVTSEDLVHLGLNQDEQSTLATTLLSKCGFLVSTE